MPLVTITGNLRDHGIIALPTQFEQRLWFKPNKGHLVSGYALDGARVFADLTPQAGFSAGVWSEPNDPDFWYTLCTDWLIPGQETEPTEERARGFFEWPQRIYPDAGGPIGDLIGRGPGGGGLVAAGPTLPDASVRWAQFQWDTDSGWVFERKVF